MAGAIPGGGDQMGGLATHTHLDLASKHTGFSDGSVAVVIPSFRVGARILSVLDRIGTGVDRIYVVDDNCPEGSGRLVEDNTADRRVKVLYNASNLGVGGATLVGMRQAATDGADVIVKIDGDGQMESWCATKMARITRTKRWRSRTSFWRPNSCIAP